MEPGRKGNVKFADQKARKKSKSTTDKRNSNKLAFVQKSSNENVDDRKEPDKTSTDLRTAETTGQLDWDNRVTDENSNCNHTTQKQSEMTANGHQETLLDKSDKVTCGLTAPAKTETDEKNGHVIDDGLSYEAKVATDETGSIKIPTRVQSATSKGSSSDDVGSEIITLNIGGFKHQTKLETISQFPTTRLAKLADSARLTGKREYFFDRHPTLFGYILNFYRIGKLHVPISLCGPLLREELDFWEIDDKDIEMCCWVHYISFEDTLEMIDRFEQDDKRTQNSARNVGPNDPCWYRHRPRVWRALQDPYSSKGATFYAVTSLLVVLLSISVFILETLPYFEALTVHATSAGSNITSDMLRHELDIFYDITPYDILLIIDNSCNVFFFLEFLVKLLTAPSKKGFLTTPLTIIEAICIVPYYIAVAIVFLHPDPITLFTFIRVLFAFRVLRIFRIFILMKHFLALKILIYTIKASTKELFLLLLVVIIGVVIFACIEYYMEMFSTEESDFKHIPLAFWWAIVTMTTVGYGDMTPKSGLGYLVGSLCAISGVLVIALSVPAIVNNFTLYYTHAQSREKLKQRKRKFQIERWNKLMTTTVYKIKFNKTEDKGHSGFKTMMNGLMQTGDSTPKINSVTPLYPEVGLEQPTASGLKTEGSENDDADSTVTEDVKNTFKSST
ncbi:potassium voltage-gated channel protein Shaw-like [Mizuhopecten yessoensis]|uniref:Potassium voltage-gated channel subfamily C member 2 n=1 Tax=Mizuhopecten yessoensis TaxID=6573 RepID=A0A210PUV5_MIZYE|nr:potassium voltage-gated channel protein Shaw-like [Mizuhopecten yessoensis]OWF40279.1 Potassium voltage-gated channel subfamily C member 2 [Mizuhopecten yessoensis]